MSRFAPHERAGLFSPAFTEATRRHEPYASARAIYGEAIASLDPIPALAALDAQTYLTDDVLVKVDRMSMLNSLEVRAPFLDHILLELVTPLPFSLKQRGRVTKWALREIARPLLPPDITSRGKQGFSMPLARWFHRGLAQLGQDVLLDARCDRRGWLSRPERERLLAPAKCVTGHHAQQVFTLVCLELWAQRWVDGPRE